MKRDVILKLTLALILALSLLCSCEQKQPENPAETMDTEIQDTVPESSSAETTAHIPTEEELHSASLAEILRNNMPRTDGSTSAIPLDAAIRAGIFNISTEEAAKQVTHTTSYDSFSNLLYGNCDFVFCHLLSDGQLDEANSNQVKVEQTAIAREGFVFLVSTDNPVDSLTVEQLKAIYSGEITNWKDVGGENLPIVAFQRNLDSGSQNYMTEFMDGTPLTDAPTELRPGNMDTLVDAVAAYNGEGGSIGYSVYSYVGGMYDADGGAKILKVNSVAPDYESIADGSYPCTGYNYVVFRADEADGSPARLLLEWILTDAGQTAIALTGYFAPLNPTSGVEVTIKGLELYTDTGTGKESIDECAWYYDIQLPTEPLELPYENGYMNESGTRRFSFDITLTCPVTGNAELDAVIERYMLDEIDRMVSIELESDINTWEDIPSINISGSYSLINGYLSLVINRGSRYYSGAVWDIESGKRLTLSDMFTSGMDFIGQLNGIVSDNIDYVTVFGEQIELLRPFYGIEADFDNFAITESYLFGDFGNAKKLHLNLYFNPDENSYFDTAQIIACPIRSLDGFVVKEAREITTGEQCRAYFEHEDDVQQREVIDGDGDWGSGGYSGEYRWLDITGYAGADKINAARYAYMKKYYDPAALAWSDEAVRLFIEQMYEYLRQNYGVENPTRDILKYCCVNIYSDLCYFGDSYVAVSYYARCQYNDTIGYGGGSIVGRKLTVYDLESGDEVDIGVLFTDRGYSGKWYCGYEACEAPVNISEPLGISYGNAGLDSGKHFIIEFIDDNGILYKLALNEDCLKWFD